MSAALLGAAGFVVLHLALTTATGQRLDARAVASTFKLTPGWLIVGLGWGARGPVIAALAALMAVLALIAAVHRRWRACLAAALIPVVAVPISYLVRTSWPVLAAPGFSEQTYPSTHASSGLAAVVGVLILWPTWPRPRVQLTSAVVAVAILWGNVASHAHRVADVVGSTLLIGAVTALVLSLVGPAWPAAARRRLREQPAVTHPPPAASWPGRRPPGPRPPRS